MKTSFYQKDLCALIENPEKKGIIERSWHDLDDAGGKEEEISHMVYDSVSQEAQRRFVEAGEIPRNHVIISFPDIMALLPESHLFLIDRSLAFGDVVKRRPQDGISGTVIRAWRSCNLKPAFPPFEGYNFDRLRDIPGEELQATEEYNYGDFLIFKGWLGRVDQVVDEVTVRLRNGSIVTVENSTELETPWIGPLNGFRAIDSAQSDRGSGNRQSGVLSFRTLAQDLFFNGFHPGMLVLAKKGNLRRGEWHHGNFVSDVDPTGYVVQIIQGLLAVQWIGHDFSDNTPKIRPDEDLGLHEITMGTEKYDRGKVPKNAPGNVQGSDLQFHNYVKFQDLTGASLKYQGQDEHGKLQVFPPAYSLGYDMNIYVITETKQQVKVQWQDLSETTEESTHLVPYINIDEHEVWPGEAIIRDMEDSGKRSIGIVQSVNAAERIAEVAWFLNPDGRFFERSKILIPDSTTRHLSTEKELVSFFEFKTCLEMSNRRGDMVLVAPSEEKDTSKGSGMNGWGEIVDLGLDGLVTVRLGALKEVQDIKVEPERVEVMFREGDPTGLDSYLAEDSPTYSPEWSSISDSAAEDLGVVQSHEEAPSIPLSGEKDWKEEAEDWLTDDDEAMQDSNESKFDMMDLDPPEGIVQRANSHRTDKQQTEKQFGAQPEALTSLDIASFSILDDEVPSDHEFRKGLENPTAKHLRRIQKEYKILSNALPDGIYVRTWEHRLDLMRVLFIGPRQTPYELAPFIVDFQFGCNFPMKPPEAHFHSWTEGIGRVNPNLYEDGKICLSLLGTWPGDEGNEKWSATQSSVLQILVSIMGLVLVKEPYYNEAGFEVLVGSEESRMSSIRYSETAYVLSRGFVKHALRNPVKGFEKEIQSIYFKQYERESLIQTIIIESKAIISQSLGSQSKHASSEDSSIDLGNVTVGGGLITISMGACGLLKRNLTALEDLLSKQL